MRWCGIPQLPELVDLARAFPDTSIVLNHMGTPLGVAGYADKREEVFSVWRGHIATLAACPNVTMKLGGFGMEIAGFDFSKSPGTATSDDLAGAWQPYVDVCIDALRADALHVRKQFPGRPLQR